MLGVVHIAVERQTMNRDRILPGNLSKKAVDRLKAMTPLTFRGQAVLFLLPLIIIISGQSV